MRFLQKTVGGAYGGDEYDYLVAFGRWSHRTMTSRLPAERSLKHILVRPQVLALAARILLEIWLEQVYCIAAYEVYRSLRRMRTLLPLGVGWNVWVFCV